MVKLPQLNDLNVARPCHFFDCYHGIYCIPTRDAGNSAKMRIYTAWSFANGVIVNTKLFSPLAHAMNYMYMYLQHPSAPFLQLGTTVHPTASSLANKRFTLLLLAIQQPLCPCLSAAAAASRLVWMNADTRWATAATLARVRDSHVACLQLPCVIFVSALPEHLLVGIFYVGLQ